MSKPPRLPTGVSFEEVAARRQLERENKQPPGTKQVSQSEVRSLLAARVVNSGIPVDNSHQLAIEQESQMTLPVMDIQLYDRNPRKAPNEDYDAIKESIRATKRLNSPLMVTRRPGQQKFMVGKGGNTRLSILQELFQETGDQAYQYTVVTYTPWRSESATLADHLVENELRSPMCFWDKAKAYAELKQLIEAEAGSTLSGRAFEQALKERGLPVGKTLLSYFGFASKNMASLGQACYSLTTTSIMSIQPAFNALERLLKHFLQDASWPEVRDLVLKSAEQSWLSTNELDPLKLVENLDQAVALKLGEAVEFVRIARDLFQRFPAEESAGLVAQARLQMMPASAKHAGSAATKELSKPVDGTGKASTPRITPSTDSTHPSTEHAERVSAPVSEAQLLEVVQDTATLFARMSLIADCLRLTAEWPTGFYMEVPENDEPIDLSMDALDRYHGWWMLAMLSEQLEDTWSARLPKDSTWRRAQRQEDGFDQFALQHYMETILGMPIDPLTLGKRLASAAESVPVWMELVHHLRRLRSQHPGRFEARGSQ